MNSQVNANISVWFPGLREKQFGMTSLQCVLQPYLETPSPSSYSLSPASLFLLGHYPSFSSFSPFSPLLSSFQAPPEEDEDGEDLSDMEEGDADASAAKQISRRQQVYCLAGGVLISLSYNG